MPPTMPPMPPPQPPAPVQPQTQLVLFELFRTPFFQCIALCIQPCEVQCRETRPINVCIPMCAQTCQTTCTQTQLTMPCQTTSNGGCGCNSGYSQCGGMCCQG
ncbi:hypothetical protein Y032_0879g2827 [Ancylostoma ceylanicum]|nr:hypothetical protein Y032_0879g2827 [Ancylostoma ceylanicum]